jgi:hypothetical protein
VRAALPAPTATGLADRAERTVYFFLHLRIAWNSRCFLHFRPGQAVMLVRKRVAFAEHETSSADRERHHTR